MTIFETRRAHAIALMQQANLGALAFVPGPNFAYLTGVTLHLMERPTLYIIAADGAEHALMPNLEHQKWQTDMPHAATVYWDDLDGPGEGFSKLADQLGLDNPLGVEGLRMRAAEYRALSGLLGSDALTDADGVLAELRLIKDAAEIADLRRAIAISETALGETYDAGIGGQTERQIAARLKTAMLAHGATGFSFEAIVLGGGASANPHGNASDRPVAPGDPLLIDFGASYGEMHADITRTVFCEYASDEHAAIYETVLAANQRGLAAVRPGTPVGDVDDAATAVLETSAFADLVLHKTGHGLGRDVHEAPQVARPNRDLQRSGMVFTVEPGLYRPGDIGVRIEDDVHVTETGHDCLTQFDRELATYA